MIEDEVAHIKENPITWTQHQDKVPNTPIHSHKGKN